MSVCLYLIIFIFIYNVPFTFLPFSGSKVAIGLLIIYLILSKKTLYIKKEEIKLVILLVILFIYSEIVRFANSSADFSVSYMCILFLINHILGSILITTVLKYENKLTIENMLHFFVVIAVIQSLIMILMMLSSQFYNFFSDLAVLETRESIRLRYGGARGYGLAASITYELGVVQSFSLIFLAFLMQNRRKFLYILEYILIIVSILVTGRTGLIGIVFSILFLMLTDRKAKYKVIRKMTGILSVLFLLGIYLLNNARENSILSSLQSYVFEAYNNYKVTGSFSTSTGINIIKMLESMNKYSIKTWIFGDGRYTGEGAYYYGNVDLGYLRHILYFGVIGCVLIFFIYFYIWKKGNSLLCNQRMKILWGILFIYLLLAHFKGDFLLGCGMGISIVLLLFFTILREEKYRNEESATDKPRIIS